MLKFLVILLDDMSASYCHYENEKKTYKLISIEDLKMGILFAMKENLTVQFVYPVSFPDFSRRFSVSLAKSIDTFGEVLLKGFTRS